MSINKQTISVYDERTFFEKVLCFGVNPQKTIDQFKINKILCDGAKGIVEIAHGTSYLRIDLENARKRIVNFVTLYLEEISSGDLDMPRDLYVVIRSYHIRVKVKCLKNCTPCLRTPVCMVLTIRLSNLRFFWISGRFMKIKD